MANFDSEFFGLVFSRVSGHPKSSRPKFTSRIVGIPLQFHFLEPNIYSRRFSAYGGNQHVVTRQVLETWVFPIIDALGGAEGLLRSQQQQQQQQQHGSCLHVLEWVWAEDRIVESLEVFCSSRSSKTISCFATITNFMGNSLIKSFFPEDFEGTRLIENLKHDSQAVIFVIISSQTVLQIGWS